MLREIPIKYIKVWKEAQARKMDRDGIVDLAKSIKNDGLLNPPMVQKVSKNEYLLMSGQRRLAAMKRLRAKTIPAHVITKKTEMTLEEAKASSVVENIHRNDMTQKDIVAAAKILAEKIGKRDAAKYLGVTIVTLYRYLGFDAVPELLKELVPSVISRDDITKIFLAVSNVNSAKNIAEKLYGMELQLKKQYVKMLCIYPSKSHNSLLQLAKSSMVNQKISLRLTKRAAKSLKVKSNKCDLSPNDLAKQILEKYLK